MSIALTITVLLLLAFLLWRLFFLRNPERVIPEGKNIVAPADGYIVYIKPIHKGHIPIAIKNKRLIPLYDINDVKEFEDVNGIMIGIFMTPWSVHRNRAPIDSAIVVKKYYKNNLNLSMIRAFVETLFRFKTYSDNEFYLTNERLTTGFKTNKGTILITQIADEWINRIVSWVKIGDKITKGEQYGMIRFGSQCDIFIPEDYELDIKVKVSQYVKAGESILGTYQ